MTGPAQVPTVVGEYFGWPTVWAQHPIIVQKFVPGRGWVRTNYRKRVSRSWVRKLRAQEGVTAVALQVGKRIADFQVKEVLR